MKGEMDRGMKWGHCDSQLRPQLQGHQQEGRAGGVGVGVGIGDVGWSATRSLVWLGYRGWVKPETVLA